MPEKQELTKEQLLLHQEIIRTVNTLHFVRTHVRWAGVVVYVFGLLAKINILLWGGFLVFLLSYMISVSIMEDINFLIWNHKNEPEEENKDQE